MCEMRLLEKVLERPSPNHSLNFVVVSPNPIQTEGASGDPRPPRLKVEYPQNCSS